MKAKLNLFQASILHWRALHPYNAVHVVRVAHPIDPVRLEAALRGQLQDLGLTGLELDARRQRYEWTGGPARPALRVIPGAGEAFAALCREIERELNAGFAPEGRLDPFRFFAIDNGAEFYLGLAYDHFVAGGDSIVILLQGMVARYLNGTRQEGPTQIAARRYGPTYAHLFRRQFLACAKALLSLPNLAASCRRAFRPRDAAPQDGYNALAFVRIDAADRARLDACANAWGVTAHDLLLAILLKGLAPLTVRRLESSTRNEIAVASIVNIRRDLGTEASDALAPYLASFRVSHPVPDDLSLRDLAAAVHAQSSRIRRGKRYLQTLFAMGIASAEWRFMSKPQRQRFYAKHFPVCAGTTPLSVDSLWAGGGGRNPVLDYVRAVSTGPLAPMILAFTMVGGVINVGISFRTTVFRRDAVDGVAAAMLHSIRTL
jgi:hypothetical protein